MIRALSSVLALMLAAPTSSQTTQASKLVSPCPEVFIYNTGVESNKWNGIVSLTTDTALYGLWLNIVLDKKANILGNWVGEVTTDNNIDFKIINTNMTLKPGILPVPFFIQYNVGDTPPKLVSIKFNGREICQGDPSKVSERESESVITELTTKTTVIPTESTTWNYNTQQTTESRYWYQTKSTPTATTTLPPQFWTEARTTTVPTTKRTPVRPPVWSYLTKAEPTRPTTTPRSTNPTRKTPSRTEVSTRTTTEQNSVTQTLSSSQSQIIKDTNTTKNFQSQSQVQNNEQSTLGNRYTVPNEIIQQTTVIPAHNQNVSHKISPNNFQFDVKQVGETKYWPKIPVETTAGVPSGTESASYGLTGNQQRVSDNGLQTEPYAKVSIHQAESQSSQNYDQNRDTPLYERPVNGQKTSNTYNVGSGQTYNWAGSETRPPTRPVTSYQQTTDQIHQNTGNVWPVQNNVQKPSQTSWSGEGYQSWSEPARNGMETGVDASGYPVNYGGVKDSDESCLPFDRLATESSCPNSYKTEEYSSSKQDEFYDGGLPVLYIPAHRHQVPAQPTCGQVLLNKVRGINLKSTDTLEGQWPWQIALYQQQTSVDFRYICGGTLISKRHVLTAAHCVTKKKSTKTVNKNTLTVYLGKHNLRTSVEGVQVKFVNRILIYPEYNATTFRTDLAILELRDTVTYTDRVQPICLWPEQETALRNVVGKTGTIVGWGYEQNGVPTKELTLKQLTVVDQETCVGSYAEFFKLYTSERTYCAGYRNHDTSCTGDSGGGMFFQKGDSWYLRGVVSLSVARQGTFGCDPSHYVIFTDVAKFLNWIENNIEDDL